MSNIQEFTGELSAPASFWHNFPDIGIKKWVLISSVIFIIGLLFGSIGLDVDASGAGDTGYLQELAESLDTLSTSDILMVILVNNILTLILCFVFSPILCLLPLLSLFINGWIISFVGSMAIQEESLGYFLLGILPHGIIEIPALILAQAAALSLGTMTIAAIIKEEKREALLPNLRKNIKYLGIALLLLIPAAIIETYITPVILNNL